ncbi:MAG: DinB family protein [Cytophagales bacterium]|nr:DinB family protein [Cytophagales bacterium]
MMKRLPIFLLLTLFATMLVAQSISADERTKLVKHLNQSQSELFATVKGLTTEQLNFKTDADSWSIAECVEHIAITENTIFGLVETALTVEADPSRRNEVQMSDDQILGLIRARENKVKTRPDAEPQNRFVDYSGSLKTFKKRRKEHLNYVKKTDDDLRNRYCQFPFGTIDAYQTILFLSGHVQRHTDQIKEVMEADNFPG